MGQGDQGRQHDAAVKPDSPAALITGAAQGIGLAIAKALAADGYRVALVDRNKKALSDIGSQFDPHRTMLLAADLADAASALRLKREIGDHWGEVAVLVNNAGVASTKRYGLAAGLLDLTDSEWSEVLEINLTAAFRMCRAFVPGMLEQGWGRVINMASLAGRTRSLVASSNYMASKAGMIALTRSIAAEFGPKGVTANAVAPGLIATPMAAARPASANTAVVAQIPVRRMGQPEEVAAAVRYLASEEAGFVNGAVLDLNGGVYMN